MDVKAFETRLTQRLEELDQRIHEIEDTLDDHHNPDWEELAVEREGDEVLESLGINHQHEMAQIKAALARIAEGEFGYCVKCGTEIKAERLDLIPHTPFCSACAM